MISVDMGCVGKGLECDETMVSICAKDSMGPYDYHNIINLRLDITHLYYPAKNSFQKGRLKRREIFTELLLYTLTT